MHLVRVRVRLTVDIITPFVGYPLLQTRLFLLQLDYGIDNLPLEKKVISELKNYRTSEILIPPIWT